jgi:hypothetical protein
MKTIYGVILTAVVASMASTVSAASMSVADAATACKAQAASQYASGEQPARVKFKGVYGGNASRKVRLQVLPADGSRAFLAVCEVDGRTGEVVGLAPRAHGALPALAAADPR